MSKELISFSTFSEECFIIEGKNNDPVYMDAPDKNALSHLMTKEQIKTTYSNKQLEKYREILEAFAVNFELLKINKEVFIPVSQKENVIWIINEYLNPVMKSFRKISAKAPKKSPNLGESHRTVTISDMVSSLKQPHEVHPNRKEIEASLEKLDPEEISDVVKRISAILTDQLEGEILTKEINKIEQRAGVMIRKALNEFYNNTLPLIIEELKNTTFITSNDALLNDIDRLALLRYYMSEMQQTRKRFSRITEIFADLRSEQLADISSEQIDSGIEPPSDLWFKLDHFNSAIEKAISIYKGE